MSAEPDHNLRERGHEYCDSFRAGEVLNYYYNCAYELQVGGLRR